MDTSISNREEKKKSPAPGGFRTHNLVVMRRVLYRCATSAALIESWNTYLVELILVYLKRVLPCYASFQIPPCKLETMLNHLEQGYSHNGNPYHNNLHACDVLQTVHYFISQTGLAVSQLRSIQASADPVKAKSSPIMDPLWTQTRQNLFWPSWPISSSACLTISGC